MRALFPWVPLGVLFLGPFVDPRRPFRLVNLDLLVLVGFSALYLAWFEHPVGSGVFELAAVLVAAGLVYLTARMLIEGFRRRDPGRALIPWAPRRWLLIGLVLLVAFRLGLALSGRADVIDVGGASVIGADLITHGHGIYDGGRLAVEVTHGDTYGPLNYLAYVPLELVWPLHGDWLEADAARAAAITFDLLTLAGLLLLGRRLRPGDDGRQLALVLGYAWVSYPYTTFALLHSTNDALVTMLLVATLLALASAPGRGVLLALAATTKFFAAGLAPLFAAGVGPPKRSSVVLFAAVFVLVAVALFLPFIPDGGIREIYDRTLGYQAERGCCGGIIADTSHLDWLQWLKGPGRVLAVGLALLVAFRPRIKTFGQFCALGCAVIAALQFGIPNWFPSYAVWLAPFAFVALFAIDTATAGTGGSPTRRRPDPSTGWRARS